MRIDGRSLLSLTAISATRIPLSADHDSLRSTPTVRFRHRHLDFHGWHAPPMFSLACKRRECFRGRAQCPNERATQWYANRELRHVIVAYFAWQISSTLRSPSRFQWPVSANKPLEVAQYHCIRAPQQCASLLLSYALSLLTADLVFAIIPRWIALGLPR